MVVPLLFVSFRMKGNVSLIEDTEKAIDSNITTNGERNFVFMLGVLGLLFVQIFKLITTRKSYLNLNLVLKITFCLISTEKLLQ